MVFKKIRDKVNTKPVLSFASIYNSLAASGLQEI